MSDDIVTREPVEENPPAPAKRSIFPPIIVTVIAFAILGAVGLAIKAGSNDDKSEAKALTLEEAEAVVTSNDIDLEDDGASLFIDGDGEESTGASIDDIVLVLVALDTPDSVVNRMSNTRALDGMQEATWGNFNATWTYHPDDGLDIIIEQTD
jgi:hypothetical protein